MFNLIRSVLRQANCLRAMFALAVASTLFPQMLSAQARAPASAKKEGPVSVPVCIAYGRIFIPVYLVNQEKGLSSSISLEVSLDEPEVLVMDGDEVKATVQPDYDKIKNGESVFIDMIFKPNMEVSIPFREMKYEQSIERSIYAGHFTARYSKYLEEHKIRGRLGRGFFAKYRTVFDIGARTITFYPLHDDELAADVVVPFEVRKGRSWINVTYADGKTGSMTLGSENYDTYVDATQARAAGKPAGDMPVWLGTADSESGINLSRYLAFRPYDFNNGVYGYDVFRPITTFVPRPQSFTKEESETKIGATFVSGANLLNYFRVEFDWSRSKVGFTSTGNPKYPAADLEFFKAELSGKADQMLAYLEQYPESRLAPEAAWKLMKWRMAEPEATDDQLYAALKWVIDTAPLDRKMEDAEGYVMRIARLPGRSHADVTLRTGELAAKYSREAFKNNIVYRLHNYMAEAYLQKNNLKDAWRHLLSAAFIPMDSAPMAPPLDEMFEDKPVNEWHNMKVQLNLAMIYEQQGRMARAYSRYRKAAELIGSSAWGDWFKMAAELSEQEIAGLPPNAKRWCQKAVEVTEALDRVDKKLPPEDRKILAGH